MSVFGTYSKYYDQLYRDKDYPAEADFVHRLAQEFVPSASTLLDLGCGTGQHALLLAKRGYSVTGVDRSKEMLTAARAHLAKAGGSWENCVRFIAGDIRDLRLGQTFDVTAALFHVISYQIGNDDLARAFSTARAHTRAGGVFIFDCWYGPGVLTDPPQVRVKRLQIDNGLDIMRISEPRMHPNENTVDVKFTLLATDPSSKWCEQICETHKMRYLFAPEIAQFAKTAGFESISQTQWLNRRELDSTSWNACFIAQA